MADVVSLMLMPFAFDLGSKDLVPLCFIDEAAEAGACGRHVVQNCGTFFQGVQHSMRRQQSDKLTIVLGSYAAIATSFQQ